MKNSLICLLVLSFCAGGAISCKNNGEEAAPVSVEPAAGDTVESVVPVALPPTDDKKENSMIVKVYDTVITQSEVDQQKDNLMRQFGARIPPNQLAEMGPKMWKQALENLINQRILLHEANRKGIQAEKEAVDSRIAEITSRYPDPEKFKEQLAGMGVSDEEFHQEIEQNVILETLIEAQTKDIKEAGQEEVEEFYRSNPDSFKKPEQVQASHILLKMDPGAANDETRTQKRLVLSRLRGEVEKGVDFAQLAREHSDCPSSSRGGDLGLFERGKMAKAFEDAAFGMKVGEVSEIVETQFGYHLIKVTDRQDAETVPLDTVQEKILSFLNRQKQEQAVGDYLEKLRGTAQIEYAEGYQP